MKTVIYVPLVNHLTRRFMAATPVGARLATPLGAAVAAPMVAPETPGPRPAILMGQPADGLGDLIVFKHPGDPSASAVPEATAFVGSVPYSEGREPGTFHLESDAPQEPFRPGKIPFGTVATPAAVKVKGEFDDMNVEALKTLAASKGIELGNATRRADILAILTAGK